MYWWIGHATTGVVIVDGNALDQGGFEWRYFSGGLLTTYLGTIEFSFVRFFIYIAILHPVPMPAEVDIADAVLLAKDVIK